MKKEITREQKSEIEKQVLQLLSELKEENPIEFLNNGKINEHLFCTYFFTNHPLWCVNGEFYDFDGYVPKSKISAEIYDVIKDLVPNSLARTTEALVNALELACYRNEIKASPNTINVANGTYGVRNGAFIEQKQICLNRLPINYNPDYQIPEKFLMFLNDLLYEEDILTLQEFMGYCLVPTNKAQAMLMLIGSGGEGKSIVGSALRAVFGDNMNTSSLKKLSESRFAKADLENKLLMLDDDVSMDALPDTDVLKQLITSDGKSESEKKGKQSKQVNFYCRLIGFSNGSLTSLYDKSDGFYRRQIILKVKSRPKDRIDDRNLAEKIAKEKDSIFMWMLEGLNRLRDNDWNFTISERSKKLKKETKKSDNNILAFLEDSQYIKIEEGFSETSKRLYRAYEMWCENNLEKPLAMRTFSGFLSDNQDALGIVRRNTVNDGNGLKVRGYGNVQIVCDFSIGY